MSICSQLPFTFLVLMRIAVWHNLPSGGGKRALHSHITGLVERGHHVESWCPPTASQTYLPLSTLIAEHIIPLELPRGPRRRPVIGYALKDLENVTDSLRAMDDHCRACASEIHKGDFDVLFANSCVLFRSTSIGRFTKLPSVLYLQEPFRWLYEALPQLPWVASKPIASNNISLHLTKERIRDWVKIGGLRIQMREEISNANNFCEILVNSLFSRESVLRAYGRDSRVCYLGVDANAFPMYDGPREDRVISVGYLSYGKGAERTVRALALLPKGTRPKLLWIGNGFDATYLAEIQALAKEASVEFEFESNVTDATLVYRLQRSMAMIYTPRLEPFGYVPLEANLCGLPVVAIAEGGIRETVVNGVNGYTVMNEDPIMLADALGKLLGDPKGTENMRRSGRRMVEEHWCVRDAQARLENELFRAVQIGKN